MIESGRNLRFSVDGGYLSYDLFYASGPNEPQIVYLPGLIREKNEAKSINLQALCKKNDMTFLSADYFGVGKSSGSFADGSVSRWTSDAIELITSVLNKSGEKKVILVGHGLGTWISFLIAMKYPELVSGIVGMSADPDFTEELLWETLSDEVKEKIMNDGVYEITWGNNKYPITRGLIEDGRKNLLLKGPPGSLNVNCPVRLIHAQQDEEVPYAIALRLLERCSTKDASIVLIKSASHSMEGVREFATMRFLISDILDASRFNQYDLTSPGSG